MTPDQPVGRPVPDTDDLRLLAEIINNGSIGLPQAAWNARMSQSEAADRLVTMAERGMPLRLVAEGDRQLLWQIAQAGPVAVPLGQPPFGALLPAQLAQPARRVLTSGEPTQHLSGLFGEQLSISLQQILDPADQILAQAGYRIDQGERSLLVQMTIDNQGSIAYESLTDLYLVLVSSTGSILPKAAMSLAQFPAHPVGVPAGALASGWTVFLVPAATEVAQLRWGVRPDLSDRAACWEFGPA